MKKIVIAGVVVVLGLAAVGVYWKFFLPKLDFVELRPSEGEVIEEDRVEVSGRTNVEATVQIAVYRGNKVVNRRYVKTSPDGAFSQPMELFDPVTETAAKAGTYRLSLVATDSRGNEVPKEISLQVTKEREQWAEVELQGDKAYSRGRYAGAIQVWEEIPVNYRPSDKIEEAKRKLELREGNELFSQGRYAEAKARWEEIPTAYRPSEKIKRAETKIQNEGLRDIGDGHFSSGEYEEAIETYGQISLEDRPLDKIEEAKKLLRIQDGEVKRERWAQENEKAREFLAEGKLQEAVGVVEAIPSQYQDDALMQQIAEAKKTIEGKEAKQERWALENESARKLLAEGNLQEARSVVGAIPSQYQDDALMQQIEEQLSEAEKWARENENARRLLAEGNLQEARSVVEVIPPQYQDHALMQQIKKQLVEAEKWAQRNEEIRALFGECDLKESMKILEEIPITYRDQKLVEQMGQTLAMLKRGYDAFGEEDYREALEQWNKLPEACRSEVETEMEAAKQIVEGDRLFEKGDSLFEQGMRGHEKRGRSDEAIQALESAIAACQSAVAVWEKVPENFVVDRITEAREEIEKIKKEIEKIKKHPLKIAMDAVERGNFEEAVEWFGEVEPSDTRYLAARWNIAILSLTEGPTQDVDRAIRELDSISQIRASGYRSDNVFVRFYKGIAHYRKGRTYEDMLDGDNAKQTFKEAVRFFEKAKPKIPEFSTMKIENTLIPHPERNVTDLYYYIGMSYFFLYQYAVFDVEDPGVISSYRRNARDNLIKCRGKSPTPEQQREIPTILGQLR